MFRRLRGILSGDPAPAVRAVLAPVAQTDPTTVVRKVRSCIFDRSDNVVEVVGESWRQDALELIGGGRGPSGVRNVDHVAGLLPEPDNPADPQAIAVQIDARLVGYLNHEDARAYRPVIDRVLRQGLFAGCHASLTGGWDSRPGAAGAIGVRLHLGTPAELWAELDEADGAEPPPIPLRTTRQLPVAVTTEWDGEFAGKSVCFTAPSEFRFRGNPVTRGMHELLAVQHGMTVRPGVSKKVDVLVIGRDHPRTGKVKKAEELGTIIVDEASFSGPSSASRSKGSRGGDDPRASAQGDQSI